MPNVDKLRQQREREAQQRIDQERAERRVKEQREREMRAKELERRRVEMMAMERQQDRKANEIADGEKRASEALEDLEAKRREQQALGILDS